ncbi:hypothetical protein K438DRAFT_2008623 [Mycena galopus ATCC 62051]|nr:hypothetical protein K438DRAFT_2008623 [Mycena galopus ATCC 62051]
MPEGSGHSAFFKNEYKNARLLRPDTPFTSQPLRDDFDAATQRWSRTTRVTTVEPTSYGLLDELEAMTRATTPAVAKPRRRKNKGADGHVEIPREHPKGVVTQERSLRRTQRNDRIKASEVDGNLRTRTAPPLAGQDFEMVGYQLLEEGPERTVSISTWREQAIEEADSDQEMSVYFVEPGDYIPLGTGAAVENPASSGAADTSPHNEGTKTYRSVSKAASPSPHSSGPRTSTPRGSGTLLDAKAEIDIPPTGKGSSPWPFHAKKADGSTISSIHLTPALDQILVSCEPSLVHISPMLQKVGILGAEHLRAVGKLSEDTRNREIKEEVLKLGVTVIEWAILLDKLQSL